eukprot:4978171-Lingulodinium_polyedra.AAC.1
MGTAARLTRAKSRRVPAVVPGAQHVGPAASSAAPGRIAGGSSHRPLSRAVRTASKWWSSPLKSPTMTAGPEVARAISSKTASKRSWARARATGSTAALV